MLTLRLRKSKILGMENTNTYTLNDLANGVIRLYIFTLTSKRSRRSYNFSMIGTDRDDARQTLIENTFKNQNWNRWTLTEAEAK